MSKTSLVENRTAKTATVENNGVTRKEVVRVPAETREGPQFTLKRGGEVPIGIIQRNGVDYCITAEIGWLTPELAQTYLSRCAETRQRGERPGHQRALIKDLTEGRWEFTGQPIIFDETGSMIDGRHRCRAVLTTGRAIPVLILYGVPAAAYYAMDNAAKRSGADVAEAHGMPNRCQIASVAKLVWLAETGKPLRGTEVLTPAALDGVLREHPGIADSVKAVHTITRDFGTCCPAFLHYYAGRNHTHLRDEFFDRLRDGIGLMPYSPIYALREAVRKRKLTRDEALYALVRAWNAYVSGEQLSKIQIPAKFSVPMPL